MYYIAKVAMLSLPFEMCMRPKLQVKYIIHLRIIRISLETNEGITGCFILV